MLIIKQCSYFVFLQVHDNNGDGFIDVDEFLQIVHSIGFTDIIRERGVTMIAKVDSDGDGKINLEGESIHI